MFPNESPQRERWGASLNLQNAPCRGLSYEVPRLGDPGSATIILDGLHTLELTARDPKTGQLTRRVRLSFSNLILTGLGPGTIEVMSADEIETTAERVIDALPARTKEEHDAPMV